MIKKIIVAIVTVVIVAGIGMFAITVIAPNATNGVVNGFEKAVSKYGLKIDLNGDGNVGEGANVVTNGNGFSLTDEDIQGIFN